MISAPMQQSAMPSGILSVPCAAADKSLKSEYGGVPVSTGIEKQGKRVEALDLYKTGNLNINANTDYAYAA